MGGSDTKEPPGDENDAQGASFSFGSTTTSSSAHSVFIEGSLLNMCSTGTANTFTVGTDFEVVFDPRKACATCGKPIPPYGVFDATSGKGYCSRGCRDRK